MSELGFRSELEQVINRHSMEERGGNTPDFILAEYLNNCLKIFDETTRARDRWYGNASLHGPGRIEVADSYFADDAPGC